MPAIFDVVRRCCYDTRRDAATLSGGRRRLDRNCGHKTLAHRPMPLVRGVSCAKGLRTAGTLHQPIVAQNVGGPVGAYGPMRRRLPPHPGGVDARVAQYLAWATAAPRGALARRGRTSVSIVMLATVPSNGPRYFDFVSSSIAATTVGQLFEEGSATEKWSPSTSSSSASCPAARAVVT